MKKRLFLITIILTIGVFMGGCRLIRTMFDLDVELTPRQCEILWSEGLPAEWDELTIQQQDSIVAIEELLTYLEKKYDKKFCYKGYKPASRLFGDEESLLAYAEGDDPETMSFVVTRDKRGIDHIEDTYDWVLAMPEYQAETEDRVKDVLNGYEYKVFVDLLNVEDGMVTAADAVIVVTGEENDEMENLFNKIVNTLEVYNEVDTIVVYCVDERIVKNIDNRNRNEILDLTVIKKAYFSHKNDRKKEK